MLAMMNSPIFASSPPSSLWLTLARLVQILIICLTVGLFIMSIPLNYEQRSVVCEAEPCPLVNSLTNRKKLSLKSV